jgi:succinyl-CoA synthetase beta subunit
MNLHEYQAKELLKKYNVPVQEGVAVETVDATLVLIVADAALKTC